MRMSFQKQVFQESEPALRVLFESATLGILVVDDQGLIVLANPSAQQLFGYSQVELAGNPIEVLLPDCFRFQHTQHPNSFFANPTRQPTELGMEMYAVKKGDETIQVEVRMAHFELDQKRLTGIFVTDLSHRAGADQMLAERDAWFKKIADHLPVMIWMAGPDAQCKYVNETWLAYTGRSLAQELGNGWKTLVHPDDLEECLQTLELSMATQQPFVQEFRYQRHDGQYRWLQQAGRVILSANQQPEGFVGSCTDIHDQHKHKDELEKQVQKRTAAMYQELQREQASNELKSKFVSMASHEFRLPLSIVLTSTSLIELIMGPERDERISKHLERIKLSVQHLTAILNDFLSIDKLEQGLTEILNDIFDLEAFMQEVIESVSFLQKNGQYIYLTYVGERMVQLDREKLRHILTNLLTNALKYSGEDRPVYISAENKRDRLIVSVQDQGIGIPPEEQPYLFHKFFRAKNAQQIQGTGLGLTIVKRCVDLLQGSISFVSEPGSGTSFTIELPQPAIS